MFVYDVTNRESFEWVKEASKVRILEEKKNGA